MRRAVPRASRLLTGVLLVLASGACAQTFPSKPVRFVVGYAPGGISDIAARIVGAKLTEMWGQQVIVENRPGGNGFIGAMAVVKAAPDGTTMLIHSVGDYAVAPVLFKDIPFSVERDLVPVTTLSDTPCVIAVHADAPYKTMADLLADAKTRPGKIPYATPGTGTLNQVIMEWIALATSTSYQHIPYKGGAPAGAAVAAGDVPVGVLAVSSAVPHLKSGRQRVLAITTSQRSAFNPEWPTLIESGVPDIISSNWTALMAPKGTPQAVIDKVHADVHKVLALPDVQQRFAGGSATVIPSTPAELAARITRETAAYKAIIEKANIQAE